MPKYRATIKIRLRGSDLVGREEFWKEFENRIKFGISTSTSRYTRDDDDDNDELSQSDKFENLFRTTFVGKLTDNLNRTLGGTAVIFRGFEYGSFNTVFDVIPGLMSAIDLTSDDLLSAFMVYTPIVLRDIFGERANRELVLGADVRPINGTPVPISAPTTDVVRPILATVSEPFRQTSTTSSENVQSDSRFAKFWLVSNLSLVVPTLIILGAAVLLFLGAQDEKRIMLESIKYDRAEFTKALVAERDQLNRSVLGENTELRAAQQKLLERLEAQTTEFQRHVIAEAQHLGELEEVQTEFVKGRVGQDRSTKTSAAVTLPVTEPNQAQKPGGPKKQAER